MVVKRQCIYVVKEDSQVLYIRGKGLGKKRKECIFTTSILWHLPHWKDPDNVSPKHVLLKCYITPSFSQPPSPA